MVRKRRSATTNSKEVGLYFNTEEVDFFSTGCTLLDCVLGGGWADGHMINIVGDSATAKSLLAMEGCINYLQKHQDGQVVYCDTEAAFNPEHAQNLGLPEDRVRLERGFETVDDVYNDLQKVLSNSKNASIPVLYIIDSLDGLTDESEMSKELNEQVVAPKARKISRMLRVIYNALSQANVTIMIISQVRHKIGVTFGETKSRSGGEALRFYCWQELWLSAAQNSKVKRSVRGMNVPVGIKVKAKTKKNRCAPNYQECEFPVRFNFGVDDLMASIVWLETNNLLTEADLTKEDARKLRNDVKSMDIDAYWEHTKRLSSVVSRIWQEIQNEVKPKFSKYSK